MSTYHHAYTELFSEFLLIYTHQNLLEMPQPSQCLIKYFENNL